MNLSVCGRVSNVCQRHARRQATSLSTTGRCNDLVLGAGYFTAVASSSDGIKLVVARRYEAKILPGQIFTSADSGGNWKATNAPSAFWAAVASSCDGKQLFAAQYSKDTSNTSPGHLYTSSDSGGHWKATNAPAAFWGAVASSSEKADRCPVRQ